MVLGCGSVLHSSAGWLGSLERTVVRLEDEISSKLKLKSVWFAAEGVSGESVRRCGGGDLWR